MSTGEGQDSSAGHGDRPRGDLDRGDFGEDFTWGVASAAFQVEGAPDVDGKAPSVWDDLVRRGRIPGPGADRGIGFYDRYREDQELIASLGFGANRISLSWPRLMGDGTGPWNPAGADFYDRVIDHMLEIGLEPWVTVHHWDMPLGLWRQGGWCRREIIEEFADFAERCANHFGDRVKRWMVFNEPTSIVSHILIGQLQGRPGFHYDAMLRSTHHINLAGAEAGRRMRAALPADAEVGTTHVLSVVHPYEPTDERTARRKRAIEALSCDIHVDPAGGRGYPFDATKLLLPLRRHIRDGDLEAATFRYDFMGLQCYGPLTGLRPAPVIGPIGTRYIRTAEARMFNSIGIPQDPDSMLWALRKYADHPAANRLVVTEGGFGGNDRLEPDGSGVRDDVRVWIHRRNLQAILAARSEGIDVDGYFAWSYADNVEWFFGRGPRFGLVYVDYDDDDRRIPKDSARWFQRLLTGGEDDGSPHVGRSDGRITPLG